MVIDMTKLGLLMICVMLSGDCIGSDAGIRHSEMQAAAGKASSRAYLERRIREHHSQSLRTGSTKAEGRVEMITLAEHPDSAATMAPLASGVQARTRGVIEVDNDAIPTIASLLEGVASRSGREMERRIFHDVVSIEGTAIRAAELLSIEPTGVISRERSTGAVRTYNVPGLGIVVLSEDNYIESGTVITLVEETMNTDVNGYPARSYAARTKDGRGKAEVRWVTPTKSYWMTLVSDDGGRIEQGERTLMHVARAISSK